MTAISLTSTTPSLPVLSATQANKLAAYSAQTVPNTQGSATVPLQLASVPYNTPILKFDASAGLQILINRDPNTGAVTSQIPTAVAIQRYQQGLTLSPGGPIAPAPQSTSQQQSTSSLVATAPTPVASVAAQQATAATGAAATTTAVTSGGKTSIAV